MRGLQLVLELLLPLQRFDERFLREILRVVHIADNAVNLPENAPQIVVDEALLQLPLGRRVRATVLHHDAGRRQRALGRALSFEPAAQESASLGKDDVRTVQTWKRTLRAILKYRSRKPK